MSNHHRTDGPPEDEGMPDWITRRPSGDLEFGVPDGLLDRPLADLLTDDDLPTVGAAIDLLSVKFAGLLSSMTMVAAADNPAEIRLPEDDHPGRLFVGPSDGSIKFLPVGGGYYRMQQCYPDDVCVFDEHRGTHRADPVFPGGLCLMVWERGCDFRFVADPRRAHTPQSETEARPGLAKQDGGRIVMSDHVPPGATEVGSVDIPPDVAERLLAPPGGRALVKEIVEGGAASNLSTFQLLQRICAAKPRKREKLLTQWDALAAKYQTAAGRANWIGRGPGCQDFDPALFIRLRETPGGYEMAANPDVEGNRRLGKVVHLPPGPERDSALAEWDDWAAKQIGLPAADVQPSEDMIAAPDSECDHFGFDKYDNTAFIRCFGCRRLCWYWDGLPQDLPDAHPVPPLAPDCPQNDVPKFREFWRRCATCGKFPPDKL